MCQSHLLWYISTLGAQEVALSASVALPWLPQWLPPTWTTSWPILVAKHCNLFPTTASESKSKSLEIACMHLCNIPMDTYQQGTPITRISTFEKLHLPKHTTGSIWEEASRYVWTRSSLNFNAGEQNYQKNGFFIINRKYFMRLKQPRIHWYELSPRHRNAVASWQYAHVT